MKTWSLAGGYYCQHEKKEREKMKHETRDATHGCMHFEGHCHNQIPLDTQIFPNRVPAGPISAGAGGTLLAAVISSFFFPSA